MLWRGRPEVNDGLGFPTPTRLNLHPWRTRPAVKGTNQEEQLWWMEMTLESATATTIVEVFLSLGPNKRTFLSLAPKLILSLSLLPSLSISP